MKLPLKLALSDEDWMLLETVTTEAFVQIVSVLSLVFALIKSKLRISIHIGSNSNMDCFQQ